MQKRAIAVHDISCVGRCSLTVALPVLSAAGLNTAIVPTALLSTHTGEFTGYTHLDLSDQLLPIARHLSTLGLHYDAFYSGYLASGAQVDAVLSMMDLLCDNQTHIFVDPAFADQGRMYSLMDASMPARCAAYAAGPALLCPISRKRLFCWMIPPCAASRTNPRWTRSAGICAALVRSRWWLRTWAFSRARRALPSIPRAWKGRFSCSVPALTAYFTARATSLPPCCWAV